MFRHGLIEVLQEVRFLDTKMLLLGLRMKEFNVSILQKEQQKENKQFKV